MESNLASLLVFRGEYDEAEVLYNRVLDTRRRAYGPGDADLSNSLRSLGNLLYLKGDFVAAEANLRRALALREREYGPDSTRTAAVWSILGRVLHAQDRLEEAEEALRRVLAIRIERLGEDHLHVALTRKDLASLTFDRGDQALAEELWSQDLSVLRAKKPADSWELADADSQLGARLAGQGRYEAAEPLLIRSRETLLRVCGERSLYTRQAQARLEDLYRRWSSPSSKQTS